MKFTTKQAEITQLSTDCLVVGVHEGKRLSAVAETLDGAAGGFIHAILKDGDIKGKPGDTLLLRQVPGLACQRLLLVGCGNDHEIEPNVYGKILTAAGAAMNAAGIKRAVNTLATLPVKGRDLAWKVTELVRNAEHQAYRFNRFKKDPQECALHEQAVYCADKSDVTAAKDAVAVGQAIGAGQSLARDLGNLPGNICTPSYLADEAKRIEKHYDAVKVKVLDKKDITELKMGSFLSVARGSHEEPRLITLQYNGGNKGDQPQVLVGKGVTFDSGGISLKPGPAMDEMKYDMCGAASVLGTIVAIAEMKLPINVVGVIPATENLPGGSATKPGDVVVSMSGQSIEILNTDAEGRLILCDALTYAARFKPARIIDIATLTGACVIALGKHASGLLGNDEALVDDLLEAGKLSGDRAWNLPLWTEYDEQLKSNFADIPNISGGRDAGTITAACFLSRFTKDYHWAHLDIAGTAWLDGAEKGATGRPVPLLVQYLRSRC
ncbi:MAG: leucyl aminopeptidase [Gammaproteobacteria bacterium]|nr:leucyl aminopeptidase [Gammaproteobacteria bacterium]